MPRAQSSLSPTATASALPRAGSSATPRLYTTSPRPTQSGRTRRRADGAPKFPARATTRPRTSMRRVCGDFAEILRRRRGTAVSTQVANCAAIVGDAPLGPQPFIAAVSWLGGDHGRQVDLWTSKQRKVPEAALDRLGGAVVAFDSRARTLWRLGAPSQAAHLGERPAGVVVVAGGDAAATGAAGGEPDASGASPEASGASGWNASGNATEVVAPAVDGGPSAFSSRVALAPTARPAAGVQHLAAQTAHVEGRGDVEVDVTLDLDDASDAPPDALDPTADTAAGALEDATLGCDLLVLDDGRFVKCVSSNALAFDFFEAAGDASDGEAASPNSTALSSAVARDITPEVWSTVRTIADLPVGTECAAPRGAAYPWPTELQPRPTSASTMLQPTTAPPSREPATGAPIADTPTADTPRPTQAPSTAPTTAQPMTLEPTTVPPTIFVPTLAPTLQPTTAAPTAAFALPWVRSAISEYVPVASLVAGSPTGTLALVAACGLALAIFHFYRCGGLCADRCRPWCRPLGRAARARKGAYAPVAQLEPPGPPRHTKRPPA
ncbi:hypothetical protein M885DRAFT_16754 [Pelagophyceae sp. CCMP2097]|nr:hypothetical protein M885DRAFT_16754 [Pelagophyceae sp. CCMP2097]